ncbi:carbohydrate ABC transporter permease [Paenibacillus macerans]|uniref:carbohydrate ABC transporter permease n=1 Tax=Paenibacillus macerans TaxID=44252 RepID=UPI003D310084
MRKPQKARLFPPSVFRTARRALIYAVLVLGGLTMILPFYWMITTSLKTPDEVVMLPPQWIPPSWKWGNYRVAWEAAPFGRYLLNSMIVTLLSTLGELITSILAAFAFAQLRFYGRELLFSLLLATMMIPGEILLTPNFVTLTELGWIDRYEALIVPWTASVFAIFLFRQYFLGIPEELYAAARIDGSGDFTYLWRIMVPLAGPVIITSGLIKVIGSWNAFLWPLIVTNSAEMRTLPVGLTAFVYDTGKNYELLMAASSMIILPMIALYLSMQKYVVEGIARTGIKG